MSICVVCGQPFLSQRVDKLTCSPRCRTQRYRQGQHYQRVAQGKLPWHKHLSLVQPTAFGLINPPDQPTPPKPSDNRYMLTPQQWTPSIELLNHICSLWQETHFFSQWQGERGTNFEPPEDQEDHGHGQICQIILGDLHQMARLESRLQQARGEAGRWLAPHLVPLSQLRLELTQLVRQWALEQQEQQGAFVVVFGIALQHTLASYRQKVASSWFSVFEHLR